MDVDIDVDVGANVLDAEIDHQVDERGSLVGGSCCNKVKPRTLDIQQ